MQNALCGYYPPARQAEFQRLVTSLATTKMSYGGAVGDQLPMLEMAATVEELTSTVARIADLKTSVLDRNAANLREACTFLLSFGGMLDSDLLKGAETAKFDEFAKNAKLDTDRINELRGKGMWGANVETDMSTVTADASVQALPAAAQTAATNPNPVQWTARFNRNKAQTENDLATTSDISTRTAGDLAPGAGLSDRETSHQKITDEAPTLKWSEGAKMWALNELDTWVSTMRALSLPLAAGPSGTTNGLMNVVEMVGGLSGPEARLVAIGYLLPIHAHSLVEVMAAAGSHGVPYTAGQSMYHNIAPFAEDDLRANCGLTPSGAKGKRFPDEAPLNAPVG